MADQQLAGHEPDREPEPAARPHPFEGGPDKPAHGPTRVSGSAPAIWPLVEPCRVAAVVDDVDDRDRDPDDQHAHKSCRVGTGGEGDPAERDAKGHRGDRELHRRAGMPVPIPGVGRLLGEPSGC